FVAERRLERVAVDDVELRERIIDPSTWPRTRTGTAAGDPPAASLSSFASHLGADQFGRSCACTRVDGCWRARAPPGEPPNAPASTREPPAPAIRLRRAGGRDALSA